LRKKNNTYKPTDVNYHGGMEHGANIHAVSVQVNQYVWDMIKVLNQNNLYGFDFQAKIGTKRTVVVLNHEDSDMLIKARRLLEDCHNNSNFVFLTKVKKTKKDKTIWFILGFIIFIALIGWGIFSLFDKKLIFNSNDEKTVSTEVSKPDNKIIVEEIEIDIDKLNALKDIVSEQNNSISEPIMKAMEITTSVISSLVSEEEKAKYSTKNLVEQFKGKSGIKFVFKEGNLSKDFNATVKELNGYADKFIKDNNISLALACYKQALNKDTNKTTNDERVMTLINQSKLYDELGKEVDAKNTYKNILKTTKKLAKDDFIKYGFTKGWSLTKLANIDIKSNQKPMANSKLIEAEKIYKMLIIELRKKALDGKTINQATLAWALNFLSDFYENDKKEYIISIEIRKEAESTYKKLTKQNPKKYRKLYYKTLNSLGKSYLKIHKTTLATKYYTKGLTLTKKLPKKYTALSFSALGIVEVVNKDFDRAERYYKKALKIYKKLAKKHPKRYKKDTLRVESLFAGLEVKRGNIELAQREYKKIILSYKEMNRKSPLTYNLHIAKELNQLASTNFALSKNFLDAEIKIFEAISFCKKAKKIESKKAKAIQAESYRYLAYLATLEQNMQTAWDYYKKANAL